jgi:hypothetical protein
MPGYLATSRRGCGPNIPADLFCNRYVLSRARTVCLIKSILESMEREIDAKEKHGFSLQKSRAVCKDLPE